MYELYAILSHSGTALGGHYYAYPCLPGFPRQLALDRRSYS